MEQTLGSAVRLIYIHAALIFVCLILVTAVGALGLLYLATGKEVFLAWSYPTKLTTISFWLVYLATSFLAMKLTWGGIVWGEPRLLLGSAIFFVLVAVYLLSSVVSAPKLISFFNLLMGGVVWVLILRVPSVMHPSNNPIRSSSSLPMKLSTLAILLLFLAAAFQLTRLLKARNV